MPRGVALAKTAAWLTRLWKVMTFVAPVARMALLTATCVAINVSTVDDGWGLALLDSDATDLNGISHVNALTDKKFACNSDFCTCTRAQTGFKIYMSVHQIDHKLNRLGSEDHSRRDLPDFPCDLRAVRPSENLAGRQAAGGVGTRSSALGVTR
jgi:hypothetical protein